MAGTKYACNLDIKRGPNMLAISIKKDLHVILRRSSILQAYLITIEKDCKYIWSVSDLRLQGYLVPAIKIITTICGPFLYES